MKQESEVRPQILWTPTRQRLELVFSLYRQYRIELAGGSGLIGPLEPAYPEFQDAMDPDLIHGSGGSGGMKVLEDYPSPREEMMREHVRSVDSAVAALPSYQRELVRLRYMTKDEPLPTDKAVLAELQAMRPTWTYQKRFYDQQKGRALRTLARVFGIAVEDT